MILDSPKQLAGLSSEHRAHDDVDVTLQFTLRAFCPIFMGRNGLPRMSCVRSAVMQETSSQGSAGILRSFGSTITSMIV